MVIYIETVLETLINICIVPMSNSPSIPGDRLHMLLYHGDPDDSGHIDSGLDPGGGLAGRPLHAVH